MSGSAFRTRFRTRKAGLSSTGPGGLTRLASALWARSAARVPELRGADRAGRGGRGHQPDPADDVVLLAPLHTNTALFAKQAASLDRISGGRLVLGLGIGGREDDFAASGLTMAGRGQRFDEQLAEMQRIWAGEGRGDIGPIGPTPARPGGPELILGGSTEASFRRVARVADGWIMGGGTPAMFAQAAAAVDQAWQDEGRPGKPRKLSLAYFALGPDARALADGYLGHYYAFLGDIAGQIAASAAVSPEMVKGYAAAFAEAGCDELIFVPTSSSLEQVGCSLRRCPEGASIAGEAPQCGWLAGPRLTGCHGRSSGSNGPDHVADGADRTVAAADHVCDQPGPSGLVRGADSPPTPRPARNATEWRCVLAPGDRHHRGQPRRARPGRHDQTDRRLTPAHLQRAPAVHLHRRHRSRPGPGQQPQPQRRGLARVPASR